MIKKVMFGVTLSLLAALAFIAWQYRLQITQIATLQSSVSQYQHAIASHERALDEAREELVRLERTLAEREARQQAIQAQRNRLLNDIEELRHQHEDVNEWAATRVPDAVIERLQHTASSDN